MLIGAMEQKNGEWREREKERERETGRVRLARGKRGEGRGERVFGLGLTSDQLAKLLNTHIS